MFNINGQMVYSNSKNETISLSKLSKGVYFLRLEVNDSYISKRIVKE
ncbi:MAG: T9SS type A sorting domain-containing protein [Flavobacteriaceae bacterium]|nr:T9SS type A sorting domain-containing protein [Flavobacteriaceae bacterium]